MISGKITPADLQDLLSGRCTVVQVVSFGLMTIAGKVALIFVACTAVGDCPSYSSGPEEWLD